MKKPIILAIALLILFVVFYACKSCRLSKKIEQKNKEIINGIYYNKTFNGKIKRIIESESSIYKISMTIDTEEEFDLDYAYLCIDENLKSFMSVGDSLHKVSGDRNIKVVKPNGEIKYFEFKFCDY